MVEFLSESGIGTKIFYYDEVETTISEDLMDALAEKLLGDTWPECRGLLNKDPSPGANFIERLRDKAIKHGYLVNSDL